MRSASHYPTHPNPARPTDIRRACLAAAAAILFAAAAARACNVPVFRYALERWPPDPYALVIAHTGDLDEAGKAVAESLREAPLEVVDLKLDGEIPERFAALKPVAEKAELPHFYLLGPRDLDPAKPVWSAPFTAANVQLLLASPAREQLGRDFAAGHAAVFFFIPGPDAAKNTEARTALQQKLDTLASQIQLPPELTETLAPDEMATVGKDLKVRFALRDLDLEAPAEALLRATLEWLLPDLKQRQGPYLATVFGQGRLLDLMPWDATAPDKLEQIGGFLAGACSCEIKAMNPGFDLLTSINWGETVSGNYVSSFGYRTPLTGLTAAPPPATELAATATTVATATATIGPVTVTTAPLAAPATAADGDALTRNLLIVVAVALVAALAISIAVRNKAPRQ